ncbi:MAG: hypothetical protein ACRERS_09080 [Methylococcales bacterium]
MSDGYRVYRKYPNRLRCWAHRMRRAQGLKENLDQQAQRVLHQNPGIVGESDYGRLPEARGSPPEVPLTETYEARWSEYRSLCESRQKPRSTSQPATWQTKCSTIGRRNFGSCNTLDCL